jgi:hypothetical protein
MVWSIGLIGNLPLTPWNQEILDVVGNFCEQRPPRNFFILSIDDMRAGLVNRKSVGANGDAFGLMKSPLAPGIALARFCATRPQSPLPDAEAPTSRPVRGMHG